MSDDRVEVQTLERATSTDFEAIQSMQSRRLNEFLVNEWAQHAIPVPNNANIGALASVGAVDHPQAVVVGMNVFHGGNATTCKVSPGSLTQINPSWITNSDPATAARTGFLRSEVTLTYPATSGMDATSVDAWHLLCARIVEVVTSTTNVQVFDVPTQQFNTVSVSKRIETRVEFQWISGVALDAFTMTLPGLDAGGDGWEPIAYVSAVTGGSSLTANNCTILDVARRVAGLSGEIQSNEYTNSVMQVGGDVTQRLVTATSPDSGSAISGAFAGFSFGSRGGEKTILFSPTDNSRVLGVDATDGSAIAGVVAEGTLTHFYLCPLVSPTRRRWPLTTQSVSDLFTGVKRGLIVESIVQPTRTRGNSAAITLSSGIAQVGKWINQATVPIGAAQYLCSGHYDASGLTLYPFVMSSGGRVLYPTGERGAGTNRCPLLLNIPGLGSQTALNRAWTLFLATHVPHIATAVYLLIDVVGDQFEMHHWEVRNYVSNTANQTSNAQAVAANANSGELLAYGETVNTTDAWVDDTQSSLILRVPVGWVPSQQHPDVVPGSNSAYHLGLVLREWSAQTGTGLTVGAGQVRLLGWEI